MNYMFPSLKVIYGKCSYLIYLRVVEKSLFHFVESYLNQHIKLSNLKKALTSRAHLLVL